MKKTELLILTLFVILAVLPIGYGFYYIDKYGVNIPLDDQWDTIVPWTVHYYEGTFDPARLIANENDSRAFFPNLIMMGISIITRLDIKTIFYAGYLFYVCFMVLVAWLLFKELNIQNKYFFLFLLPVFYYAFNPYYLFRFIYNLGSMSAIVVLLALLTIYTLDRSKKQESKERTCLFFGLSILLGVMCSFSGASGLSIWFAGLIQISLQHTNEKIKKIIIWIISAGILFYTYFIGLTFYIGGVNGIHGPKAYSAFLLTAITYPLNKFLCFMGVLGAEVIHDADFALFFGVFLTGIFILLLYTNRNSLQLDKYSKWYALMVFGTLTGLEVALTRSGAVNIPNFGSPETFLFIPALRHSLDIFLPMMCIFILASIYTKDSIDDPEVQGKKISPVSGKMAWNLVILGMILTLMVCGVIFHVLPGVAVASQSHNKNINNQYFLLNYGSVSDTNLKQMHPNPDTIKTHALELEQLHLNVFSNRANVPPLIKLSIMEPDQKYDSEGNDLNSSYYATSSDKQIQQVSMPAIFEHPQENASLMVYNNIPIPQNTSLDFYIGIDEAVWNQPTSDGVTFEINITDNSTHRETTLFSRSLNPAQNYEDRIWQHYNIDLENFGEHQVSIIFITRPNNNPDYDWAWWGDPKIISSDTV